MKKLVTLLSFGLACGLGCSKTSADKKDASGKASATASSAKVSTAPKMAPFADRLSQLLKAGGTKFTSKDDGPKRMKSFSAEVQPKIASLHKFKFPDSSVQLSVVELKETKAALKKQVRAELKKLFEPLKKHDAEYKLRWPRDDDGVANMLVYKDADKPLMQKVSTAIRNASRCGIAMAMKINPDNYAEVLAADLTYGGIEATSVDASSKYADLAANKVRQVKLNVPDILLLLAQVPDGEKRSATKKIFHEKYAAPRHKTNKALAGNDQYSAGDWAILSVTDTTGANDRSVKTPSKTVDGTIYRLLECMKL